MLIKKYLKELPPCDQPRTTKEQLKGFDYLSAAKTVGVDKCGDILVIDFFEADTKVLKARFFADRDKHIYYIPAEERWTTHTIVNAFLKKGKSFSSKCDLDAASDFLRQGHWHWCYTCNRNLDGMEAICARADRDVEGKKRIKERERADAKLQSHLNMFPAKRPKKLDSFCDEVAFENTYLFFGNKQKDGKREIVCGHCGRRYTESADIKHNESGLCRRCKKKAIYCAKRYLASKVDKSKVVISYNRDKQLLMEWLDVEREFDQDGKPHFHYESASKVLYLVENGKPSIYSYNWQHLMYYYGSYWVKKDTPPHCRAFVYTGNLRDVFGNEYYHVNLERLFIEYPFKVDFVRLLDQLQNNPAAEYLCKLGLPVLASEQTHYGIDRNAKSFADVVGVSKQYLSLYKKYQPTADENDVVAVAAEREFITEEKFEYIRQLDRLAYWSRGYVSEILKCMSLTKFRNYLNKQLALYPSEDANRIIRWIKDYLEMCQELDISLNKKTLCPPDIKAYHDVLAKRVRKMRAEEEKNASREALQIVNHFFTGYQNDTFMVKVPKERADFLREGQELSHCVGSQHYYDNHIKGTKMIFFIRSVGAPDKALYTCEIDMVRFIVLQLYGFGDKAAPAPARRFANEFAKWLKTQRKSIARKAV